MRTQREVSRPAGFRRMGQERGSIYSQRIMASLVASLVIVIGLVHLPIDIQLGRIGWTALPPHLVPIEVMQPAVAMHDGFADVSPVTDAGLRDEAILAEERMTEATLPEEAEGRTLSADSRRLDPQRILNFADDQPQIVGGMAGYYLNIVYPQEAIEEGVEGRLLLTFVVERDGRTSDIRVEQSLHPACDSAAVHALRRSRFIAGRQNGETVRVRMKLPVRFMLLDEPPPPSPYVSRAGMPAPGEL